MHMAMLCNAGTSPVPSELISENPTKRGVDELDAMETKPWERKSTKREILATRKSNLISDKIARGVGGIFFFLVGLKAALVLGPWATSAAETAPVSVFVSKSLVACQVLGIGLVSLITTSAE